MRTGELHLHGFYFPNIASAIRGSGVLKSGGRSFAISGTQVGKKMPRHCDHSDFAKQMTLWLKNGGAPTPVLQPQPLFFGKIAVAAVGSTFYS